MKRLTSIFLSVLVCMVCVPALSAAQILDVSTQNFFFSPSDLTINVGDTVRWTNPTGTPHTSTSGTGCAHNSTGVAWDSGTLSNGGQFSFTFDQPGAYPYFCTFHCSLGMTGTITVNAASSTIPLPTMPQRFSFPPIGSPVLSPDPSQARPVGIGALATGGSDLTVTVGLEQFAGQVDIYFLIYIPSFDPLNIYQFAQAGVAQTVCAGFAPWMPASMGPVSADLFGTIPASSLPPGDYLLELLVTPAGDRSLSKYYLWATEFTVGAF